MVKTGYVNVLVNKKVHKELLKIKVDEELKTLSDAIQFVLDEAFP